MDEFAYLKEYWKLYVCSTGAGADIQHLLWETPGASAFLVGASFPYDRSATEEFLGFVPDKYVSRKTAIQLAQESFMRACRGTLPGQPVGVGITASVASVKPRRAKQEVYIAIVGVKWAYVRHYEFDQGVGQDARKQQNDTLGGLFQFALGRYSGNYAGKFYQEEIISENEMMDVIYEKPYFNGAIRSSANHSFGNFIYYPGSFNPLHYGHRGIATYVEHTRRCPVAYMMTCDSVHKPALGAGELLKRVSQFKKEGDQRPLLLTRGDALFVDKASQFPGSTFVIGADTAERMLEPKWYPPAGDVTSMLSELSKQETRFLVTDRKIGDRILSVEDLIIPGNTRYMFQRVPYRIDVSSTELREKGTHI